MDKKFIIKMFGEADEHGFTTGNMNTSFTKLIWIEQHLREICRFCPFKGGMDNSYRSSKFSRCWKKYRKTQYKGG